ncbi:hypothetical protein M433DRAFT_167075 [Acidomyces richmondensis BFW]|nr:MAG: hypothetical protein FE78DRAFT_92531 [Acidomyces sp. 'richmondensis']KYG44348.1 hypothetical protein M433DRAFT_167075 [Acidomyces richmondensis BFW]
MVFHIPWLQFLLGWMFRKGIRWTNYVNKRLFRTVIAYCIAKHSRTAKRRKIEVFGLRWILHMHLQAFQGNISSLLNRCEQIISNVGAQGVMYPKK